MLYEVLSKLIALRGMSPELREKIDLLYALSRLSEAQYRSLIL